MQKIAVFIFRLSSIFLVIAAIAWTGELCVRLGLTGVYLGSGGEGNIPLKWLWTPELVAGNWPLFLRPLGLAVLGVVCYKLSGVLGRLAAVE